MNRRMAILRSITMVSAATYIEYGLGLVLSIWIARALGPAEFGRYAFTLWLIGWLMTCSNHALTTSSTKFIAEADGAGTPEVASHIGYRLSRFQHVSTLVVLALFVAFTLLIRPEEWRPFLLPVTACVAISVAAKANYFMLVAIEKGQEAFEPASISTVVSGILSIALIGAASYLHLSSIDFIALFTVACLNINLINRIAFRRYCRPLVPGPIPDETARRLSRHLKLTAVLVLLISLKTSMIEVFLLNTFSTQAEIGYFSIASTLTRGAVDLFSVGLTATLLPYMAKSFGQDGHRKAARLLSDSTRFYWAAGLVIAGVGLITTPGLITLMYGHKYAEAIPAIEAMLVLAGLLLIGNSIAAFQIVVDKQDDRVRISILALSANAILGLALIPSFGLAGAVLTYAGTRLTELGLAVFYLRRTITGGLPMTPMVRLLIVGVVATGIGWLVMDLLPRQFGFVVGGAVFVLLFVPATFVVRYWSNDDYELMTAIIQRLGPVGRMVLRGLDSLQGIAAKASL